MIQYLLKMDANTEEKNIMAINFEYNKNPEQFMRKYIGDFGGENTIVKLILHKCSGPIIPHVAKYFCELETKYIFRILWYCVECSNKNNQEIFLKNIVIEWDARHDKKESILNMFFHPFHAQGFHIEDYKLFVKMLFDIIPNEIREFLMTEDGISSRKSVMTMKSTGLFYSEHNQILEDVFNKCDLPPIVYRIPTAKEIFERAGWKSYENDTIEENSEQEVVDVLEVGEICYLTKPCQHDVRLRLSNGETITKTMFIQDILDLHKKIGKDLPENIKFCVSKSAKDKTI